ncbi:MAG TPA: ABC transporter permease [Candidatus Fermentibacter daniensis]|nr:MAG: Inner membrane transport permease YbhR [candidate division Hyd24-12 bacterium ADurb.Bin004]HPH40200.1 ABC transporter permease [Candidatus Fermentibacter daniensis]HPN63078.1 ABC transporter permease [Candidatus Fermentibacter daniensis]
MASPRLRAIVRKELIQAFRDPRMRTVIFVVPVLQTLVFGYAVTTDVAGARIAVRDTDVSAESRLLVETLEGGGVFEPVAAPGGSLEEMVDRGEVDAALVIPDGFGEFLLGRSTSVQIITDGTEAVTSGVVAAYLTQAVNMHVSRRLAGEAAAAGIAPAAPVVDLRTSAWFNPGLESRFFFVPGVIAMIVMIITLMLSSMAIAREKETGTIEQVMVTPLRKWEFILGKTLPFGLIGLADIIVVTAVAAAWFGIPVRGSVLLLLAGGCVYIISTLGAGVLISTINRTQQQAMLSVFFFIMPAVLLSGFAFPVENMPGFLRVATLANPVRHMLVIVRGIFLKGLGFDVLWPQFAALAAIGMVLGSIAILRFRKSL